MDENNDQLFNQEMPLIHDFNFGEKTAEVFDDMLDRSVPFYGEMQRMIGELASDFASPGSRIYDLGCSTGNSFFRLDSLIDPSVDFVGVDSSPSMLAKAKEKVEAAGMTRNCDFVEADLNNGVEIENASVSILNLTLQFVRPLRREKLIQRIADGTRDKGCLIMIEKVLAPDSTVNRLFIEHYYEFKKRNGYSEMEISQKREALENILIPYHFDENRDLLLNNGFSACEMFFRWYNFAGLIAIK